MGYTIRRPRLWVDPTPERAEIAPTVPTLTVFPVESRNTGLLDADGNEIVYSPDPVGFPITKRQGD